ncbi:hypothetical protein E2C01_011948 [Portunus trituberculatus]|uniref:Uncharacterized protein n=1 Tax=Portunus trituberculatus TaxID=210409 RepID=A0A5B7DC89_PORTR|nr:hypothetical protein [Portunus trituberculatus]
MGGWEKDLIHPPPIHPPPPPLLSQPPPRPPSPPFPSPCSPPVPTTSIRPSTPHSSCQFAEIPNPTRVTSEK